MKLFFFVFTNVGNIT